MKDTQEFKDWLQAALDIAVAQQKEAPLYSAGINWDTCVCEISTIDMGGDLSTADVRLFDIDLLTVSVIPGDIKYTEETALQLAHAMRYAARRMSRDEIVARKPVIGWSETRFRLSRKDAVIGRAVPFDQLSTQLAQLAADAEVSGFSIYEILRRNALKLGDVAIAVIGENHGAVPTNKAWWRDDKPIHTENGIAFQASHEAGGGGETQYFSEAQVLGLRGFGAHAGRLLRCNNGITTKYIPSTSRCWNVKARTPCSRSPGVWNRTRSGTLSLG